MVKNLKVQQKWWRFKHLSFSGLFIMFIMLSCVYCVFLCLRFFLFYVFYFKILSFAAIWEGFNSYKNIQHMCCLLDYIPVNIFHGCIYACRKHRKQDQTCHFKFCWDYSLFKEYLWDFQVSFSCFSRFHFRFGKWRVHRKPYVIEMWIFWIFFETILRTNIQHKYVWKYWNWIFHGKY